MTRRIAFVIFPGFQALDLAAMTAFELANENQRSQVYEIEIVSEAGGPVRSSFAASIDSAPFGDAAYDTVVICGGMTAPTVTPGLREALKSACARARRVASICTGAFLLAEIGLLDGRRGTTHWAHARELQRRHPKVRVEEDRIFIVDQDVWTSAGMTACIDLSLAMVEADLGAAVSRSIARGLVVYHRRTGGQSQFSALLELEPRSDRIHKALAFARENLTAELSVEQLADVARLSPRQFSRAFRSETGQSPAKAVENLRMEAALALIEDGRLPNDVIARDTGFGDPERMRRAFLRAHGQPPQALRRAVRLLASA
ncbi:MAG: GlxA family transcriptional regulator [Hansschlegelia sp.]